MQASTIEKSHKFWQEMDPVGYQILLSMASTEKLSGYTLNDNLEQLLAQLDRSFERPGGVDFEQSPTVVKILASLNVILEFYLVRRYDLAYPGASADILSLANVYTKDADYGSYAELLLRRHVVFERTKILRRVFSEERLEAVASFIRENGEKYQV